MSSFLKVMEQCQEKADELSNKAPEGYAVSEETLIRAIKRIVLDDTWARSIVQLMGETQSVNGW